MGGSEFATKLGDGSEDGLLGGVHGYTEGVGDDLKGLVFHVAEDEGGAFHGSEGEHGALTAAQGFAVEQLGFGCGASGDGDGFSRVWRVKRSGVPIGIAAAAFDEIERAVHSDAIDPCAEGGLFAEAGQFFVGEEEGFLCGLLCILRVAGDAVRHAEDSWEMTVHENAKRVSVTGEGSPNRRLLQILHSAG
jgi:hypothetical protein